MMTAMQRLLVGLVAVAITVEAAGIALLFYLAATFPVVPQWLRPFLH